jgi:hypothetical protein
MRLSKFRSLMLRKDGLTSWLLIPQVQYLALLQSPTWSCPSLCSFPSLTKTSKVRQKYPQITNIQFFHGIISKEMDRGFIPNYFMNFCRPGGVTLTSFITGHTPNSIPFGYTIIVSSVVTNSTATTVTTPATAVTIAAPACVGNIPPPVAAAAAATL